MPGRRVRSRPRCCVLGALLPALVVASLAFAGDDPAREPVKSTPEENGVIAGTDAPGREFAVEPVRPVPEAAPADSGTVAVDQPYTGAGQTPFPERTDSAQGPTQPGRAPDDAPDSPTTFEADPGSGQGVPGRVPHDEPVEAAAQEAEASRARNADGPGLAAAPVEVVAEEVEAGGAKGVLSRQRSREPIKPIPDDVGVHLEKVALGRALFHDPRLSKDNTTACVSCHDLASGGDDGRKVSVGVEGRSGPINAPTVFNVALNFKQFWDGRANTLEQQIDGPVQAPFELGSLWPEVIAKLHQHESYPGRFKALYPDGINRENVKNAIAEYMRSLTTPNSRFDRWLGGDEDAPTEPEKHGYALFKHYGCVSCHQGANVDGNMFQVFGVLNNYFTKRGNITEADLGRYNVTGNPADRHAFKVPSLRVAAHTAPYLHDGSAATSRDAVDAMFEFQLGREAPDEDKEAIVGFIKTLAGENRELFP